MTDVDRVNCVAYIDGIDGPYGYTPRFAAGVVFCVLFGISMLLHTYTSVRYRTWWQLVFAVGALGEVIGWAGRTWSHNCPYQTNPFLIQICSLILAPAFFTAGIYVILGRLIVTLGRHTSPISPNTYLYIFCTIDIISLVIQAVGGGMAAVAYEKTPVGDTSVGTHIMVAGILFQLAGIIVFSCLFTWVISKGLKSRGEVLRQRKVRLVIAATCFSVLTIVIRSIYRTIELVQGWSGYLITREQYFLGLDGSMMILAVAVYNFARPGWAEPSKETAPSIIEQEMDQSGVSSQDK